MLNSLLNRFPTFIDIIALITCTGAISLRLWIPELNRKNYKEPYTTISQNLCKLVGVCILLLICSSLVLLAFRAAEMSGSELAGSLAFISPVLFKTHYGSVWIIRTGALLVLCACWWSGKSKESQLKYAIVMFMAACVVAAGRSATGHAADSGDFTTPEFFDWIHIMSASIWAGGLIAITTAVMPALVKRPEQRNKVVSAIALRFTTVALVSVLLILVSGIFNTWYEIGSLQALIDSPYGRFVTAKIIIMMMLIALGATNRYSSIPSLRKWQNKSFITRSGKSYESVKGVRIGKEESDIGTICSGLIRKIRAEALLVLVVVVLTAFLLNQIPPRHLHAPGKIHMTNNFGTVIYGTRNK